VRSDKKSPLKSDKKTPPKIQKKGAVGYNKKSALLEDAITQMNAGKYGRASSALKELLALDPHNAEARRLFATLHLRLGSLMSARTAFESLAREALERQDYWLAESLLREYLVAGPRCVPFLEMLGHVYEEKGDAMAAVAEYGKAVEVLLEDPDPDNPNRASDLFAKIRDLAPASPVAFRFAAMFDATTGLLIQQTAQSAPVSGAPPSEPVATGDSLVKATSEPGQVEESDARHLATAAADEPPPTSLEQPAESLQSTQPEAPVPAASIGAAGEVASTSSQASAGSMSAADLHLESASPEPVSSTASAPEATIEVAQPAEPMPIVSPALSSEVVIGSAAVSASVPTLEEPVKIPAEPVPAAIVPEVLTQLSSEPITAAPPSPAAMPWDQVQEVAAELPPSPVPKPESEAPVEPSRPSFEVLSQSSPFPIAEPPSAPTPMPWDHVQDSPITVPQPTASTTPEPVEPTLPATPPSRSLEGDQTIPPVASGTALSWEEILKAVEQFRTESSTQVTMPPVPVAEPAGSAAPTESIAIPPGPTSAESPGGDHQIEMTPASVSEVVLDTTPLSAPMPWEQVEHDTVAIPRLEREPEFGSIPVVPKPDAQDPTLILQAPLDHPEVPSTALAAQPVESAPPSSAAESELRILSLDAPIAPSAPVERTIHIPHVAFEPIEEVPSAASPESEPLLAEAGPAPESMVEQPTELIEASSASPAEMVASEPALPVDGQSKPGTAVEPASEPEATAGAQVVAVPQPVTEASPEDTVALAVEEPLAGAPEAQSVVGPEAVIPEPPALRLAAESTPEPAQPPVSTPGPQTAAMAEPTFSLARPVVIEHVGETSPAPVPPAQAETAALVEAMAPSEPVEPEPPPRSAQAADVAPVALVQSPDELSQAVESVVVPTPTASAERSEDQAHSEASMAYTEVVQEPVQEVEPAASAEAPAAPLEVDVPQDPHAVMPPVEAIAPTEPLSAPVAEPVAPIEPVSPSPQPSSVPAADGNIRILWDDSSSKTAPRSSSAGLLGRWLKKSSEAPAAETPVVEEPVHEPVEARPPVESGAMRREAAASAVDVLFDRTSAPKPAPTEESVAKPRPKKQMGGRAASQARMAVTILVGTCFSTTRSLILSLVALVGLVIALAAIAVGAAGLTWVFLEEQPNGAYHNLTAVPQRTLQDASKNGYFLLLGFSGPTNQDPVRVGFERKVDESDAELTRGCLAGEAGYGVIRQGASADVLAKWYRAGDPAALMNADASGVKAWAGQADLSMSRYQQWLKMPFEDWGYGEGASPNCGLILYAHRLYVAEGFAQEQNTGVDRLEADLGAWRSVLGHAKTLPIKMLAASAMNDDIAVVSGLLLRSDLDERLIGRLAKMARPLDQVEQSMRWPMQSQFVLATKSVDQALRHDKGDTRPFYVSVAAALPLPKQRWFNDYAEYYEAAGKAASEGQYSHIPKRSQFVRTPADGLTDYLVNPIEHIIGLDPLPAWETYGGLVLETDARLRLAGLQAWLRRTPPEQDLLTRLAKAGQAFYDPFTGLPMLVNMKRGLLYSVGRDLKDSDAMAPADVVASVPLMPGQDGKRSGKTK